MEASLPGTANHHAIVDVCELACMWLPGLPELSRLTRARQEESGRCWLASMQQKMHAWLDDKRQGAPGGLRFNGGGKTICAAEISQVAMPWDG
jgi:hypothetical protein